MRNVLMWNLVTLDGFFEGPKSWEIDWKSGGVIVRYALESPVAPKAGLGGAMQKRPS